MKNVLKWVIIIAQLFAYILAGILIVQLWKSLVGGTWAVENVMLALLILNLTLTFGLYGKIAKVNTKIESHISWHRGQESKMINKAP